MGEHRTEGQERAARRPTRSRRRAARILVRTSALVVAVLAALATIAPAEAAPAKKTVATTATKSASSKTVPVEAVFQYRASHDSTKDLVHGAIHAVVRIPGGTAVFYSVAGPGDTAAGVMPSLGLDTPYNAFSAWSVGIIDTKGLKYYMPLSRGEGSCLCSRVGDIAGISGTKTPLVGWAVMPPLPRNVTHVTIQFAFGTLIPGVAVTTHLPQPLVPSGWQNTGLQTTSIPLGKGWPKPPPTTAIKAANAQQSIRPLARNTANPQEATKETTDTSSISVDSNVLFAFNESTLSPQANSVLMDVASKIQKAGAGTVSIVGYTDDIGDDAYNLTLSQARAQSVLAALSKLVTDPKITFTASGMGEQDPVADNSTPEGRQLNRRVTITFTKAGK
ncbi:OmpA family protein [Humibacter sp.]|uniref:OmpA family protein n=1 Tax=Humibacter sp. TaxID=1940291 RepID=UPI003F7EB307